MWGENENNQTKKKKKPLVFHAILWTQLQVLCVQPVWSLVTSSCVYCANQSACRQEFVFTMRAEKPGGAQKEPAVCKHHLHQCDQASNKAEFSSEA